MKNNIKIILIIVTGLLLLVSCEQDMTYTGPALIEFSPYKTLYPNIQEYDDGYFISEMDPDVLDSLQVSLVAPHFDHDITANFAVLDSFYYVPELGKVIHELPDTLEPDEYDTYRNTAKEGVDFDFVTDRTFIIPANSSFGFIEIQATNLTNDDVELLLMLTPSDDVGVNENYKYYRLIIEG